MLFSTKPLLINSSIRNKLNNHKIHQHILNINDLKYDVNKKYYLILYANDIINYHKYTISMIYNKNYNMQLHKINKNIRPYIDIDILYKNQNQNLYNVNYIYNTIYYTK